MCTATSLMVWCYPKGFAVVQVFGCNCSVRLTQSGHDMAIRWNVLSCPFVSVRTCVHAFYVKVRACTHFTRVCMYARVSTCAVVCMYARACMRVHVRSCMRAWVRAWTVLVLKVGAPFQLFLGANAFKASCRTDVKTIIILVIYTVL